MEKDAGEEEADAVTVDEYMDALNAREEGANLVLGGDEGKECTYDEGYMPRQAVFSCVTCTPAGNAGVCTACSLTCHDGHEIVELWTKRRFRCDCGNSKFGSAECKLRKDKDPCNTENVYNQNFIGLYCTCHHRYPAEEDAELGEMLQCCICEDWFHEAHLGIGASEKVPKDSEGELMFDEVICQGCAPHCSFLSAYPDLIVKAEADDEGGEEAGDAIMEEEQQKSVDSVAVAAAAAATSGKEKECASSSRVEEVCRIKEWKEDDAREKKSMFLDTDWREKICRCGECRSMYEMKGVSFLLEEKDTMHSYEQVAKQRRERQMEKAESATMQLLQNLNHVHKVEFLHGVNIMTSELNAFFAEYRESGQTVSSEDIYDFFDKLKKKQRLS